MRLAKKERLAIRVDLYQPHGNCYHTVVHFDPEIKKQDILISTSSELPIKQDLVLSLGIINQINDK